MVSLNTQHGRSGGGISFDDRSLNGADDLAHEHTPLIDSQEQPYRPIPTTKFILLHIFFAIIFLGLVAYFPIQQSMPPSFLCNSTAECNKTQLGYRIALYIHAGSFIFSLIFDRVYHHYQDLSRRDGYLDFYRRTRNLRRLPLFVISTGNAILVAIIEIFEYEKFPIDVSAWYFLVGLTGVEVIITLIALFMYLTRTLRFNKDHDRPDAAQEDILSTFVTPESTANEIGYRDETYKESVLEKQGDLIRYLRERNEHLSRLVLQYKQEADFHRVIPNNNL